jgi:hypothetical protein
MALGCTAEDISTNVTGKPAVAVAAKEGVFESRDDMLALREEVLIFPCGADRNWVKVAAQKGMSGTGCQEAQRRAVRWITFRLGCTAGSISHCVCLLTFSTAVRSKRPASWQSPFQTHS